MSAARAAELRAEFEVAKNAGDFEAMMRLTRKEEFQNALKDDAWLMALKENERGATLRSALFLIELNREVQAMARAIHDGRMRALEKRVAELETRPALKYVGVWNEHRQYNAGDFVTYRGSLWHCNKAARARPGDGDDSFTLVAKRGADGRDAQ